jgi:hypothetical protein
MAKALAEVVAADVDRCGVELRGLEPLASTLPAWRSSKLSYSPIELEIRGKVNACPLRVTRGREPEVDPATVRDQCGRQKVAAVEIAAVDGNGIDLLGGIGTEHVPVRRQPGALQVDTDDCAARVERAPLALHA